jgi:hypothetical protein
MIEIKIPFEEAGNDLIMKFFGPSAEYLGIRMQQYLEERGKRNTERVLSRALMKTKNLDRPGQVPPRVMKELLENAPFCDDEVSVDYVSGVLASSRTETGDDRGSALMSTISRLSSVTLRAHYVFYSEFSRIFQDCGMNIFRDLDIAKVRLFIPFPVFWTAMGTHEPELPHIFAALRREQLVGDGYSAGTSTALQIRHSHEGNESPSIPDAGITLSPSLAGIELYMWSMGLGQRDPQTFFDADIPASTVINGITIPASSRSLRSLFKTDDAKADLQFITGLNDPPEPAVDSPDTKEW